MNQTLFSVVELNSVITKKKPDLEDQQVGGVHMEESGVGFIKQSQSI
jgi:hypothetical protein